MHSISRFYQSAMLDIPRVVIAGATSGVGKTVIAAGIARALKRRGLRIATFKAGPDFIDPSFLAQASGRACHNLDTWMLARGALLEIFTNSASSADIAIIEGMMGLFDGRGPVSDDGSTAQLARVLRAPVVLVVDASRASRSIAALVEGYRRFDRHVRLVGVIANSLASERHSDWVRQAIESHSATRVIGTINRNVAATIPSRHLGLVQAGDVADAESTIENAADIVEASVDIGELLAIARAATPVLRTRDRAREQKSKSVKIGVARDAAFTFYYATNLELLERHGAEIVEFSPLSDHSLPSGLSGIYLGGGYPELHARTLSLNEPMKISIRLAIEAGMPVYAECGGMLYLGRRLTDLDGQEHDLVGALDFSAHMESRRAALGYAEITALRDSPVLNRGCTARGHEFHWSRVVNQTPELDPVYRVETSSGIRNDGFATGSVVASYVHVHFASQPRLVPRWLEACRAWKKMSMIESHP